MVDLYGLTEKINIDDIAVCHAGPFDEVETLLKKDMELGILPPFTEEDIQKRVNPEETMAGAASFIVILEHYKPEVYKKREGFYGNISPAASGEDYHRIVQGKLNLLLQALKEDDSQGHYQAYVDNSPFSEKHIAVRAGMGRMMRNGLFYSRKYGSRCFIGVILTDKKPEYYGLPMRHDGDEEWFSRCKSCKACQNLCPGEAITDKGFNSYRCVSYLTQKKEALTKDEEHKLGLQIYGCDVCQKVCPLNPSYEAGYETGREVDLTELMGMSNKQFNQIYRQTAAGWRGKKVLQRNAEVVRKNILER
ncbi:MAG: DUF1730 domain-containing protein [Clostridia bacterium]|nr:DUF1730 domain-containing protein [Lachnospiraceae bacterium]NCC00894.1 DUF1730 domain-containing protein [Clostridia bacterium]NCD03711.1 DUF1730 domain-containing protein [Clostridia bacterium]